MSSINEVAKRANVSISTVSRVLSGSTHPVSESTRQRVLQAARELDYSPSALAQAMITGSTNIVGVVVGDSMDPYFAPIVRGVEDVAREQGYIVIVCNTDRIPHIEVEYLNTLDNYRVDGVIFAGGGLVDEEYLAAMRAVLARLRTRGASVVTLGEHQFPAHSVTINNEQAVYDATRHLTELGHREIAYISGPGHVTTSSLRLKGYRRAMEDAGIEPQPQWIIPGEYTYESGLEAGRLILELAHRPTAVVASTDVMAIGCAQTFKRNGLHVPGDISVVGVDNVTFTQFVDPPLTTISLPLYELGATGMEQLIKLRTGDEAPPDGIVLEHKLVVRQSTAPLRE